MPEKIYTSLVGFIMSNKLGSCKKKLYKNVGVK